MTRERRVCETLASVRPVLACSSALVSNGPSRAVRATLMWGCGGH